MAEWLLQSKSEGKMNLNPYAATWEPKPRRQDVTWKSEPDVIPYQEEYREDNQNLDAIKRLATHFALPKSELMSFDGDPLKYFLFMRSSENSAEKDTDDKSRRLQLLIQYCSRKAKKVIESCVLLEPDEGFEEAKELLAERFGDKFKVTNCWIRKVSDGPVIKARDREALQDLADDLKNCEITLKATGRLAQINNEDRLIKIPERCPAFLKSRWQTKVQEIRNEDHDPDIEDVRKMVRTAAKEKNDRIIGGIMDLGDRDSTRHVNRFKKPTQSKRSSGISVHTIPMVSIPASEKLYSGGSQRECYLCNGNHKLEVCGKFKRKNGGEQFKFVRSKKLCDNCLSPFHFAVGCKQSKYCGISGCDLKRKHLTSLHEPILLYERSQRGNRNGDNIDVGNSKSNGNSKATNGFTYNNLKN